ncbi:hypothetical protein SteCoe_12951 [Stentor coeruleus]|uniref:Uncharacterized protein n=1 Tax=Stentor coeruleus TaxID=5963 RepID=A0A1R2C9I8_9CILI|nr:hypothetical protein SteCoe_12951 [Stentor coeruleus]
MIQELFRLNDNMKFIQNITSELVQDAKDNEKVVIEDVMMIDETRWTIKIRSSSKASGNFRNIKIVDLSTNQEVCRIALIEPSSEVKVFTVIPLTPGNILQGFIGEKPVSGYFTIPIIKILKVIVHEKDKFEFVLKNFSKDYVQGAVVEYAGVPVCENINIEPFTTDSFVTNADIMEHSYFAVGFQRRIVSQPIIHPDQAMELPYDSEVCELNEWQAALQNEAWGYGDKRDELTLKYLILTKNPMRYEDIANLG